MHSTPNRSIVHVLVLLYGVILGLAATPPGIANLRALLPNSSLLPSREALAHSPAIALDTSPHLFLPLVVGGNPASFVLEDQLAGPSLAVATDGAVAYLGQGPQVEVFDVQTSLTPTLLGRGPILGEVVRGLAVADGRAFVAVGSAGLAVLDVREPAHMTVLATVSVPGEAEDVAIDGTLVYLAAGAAGLRVFDVRDPSRPMEVAKVPVQGRSHQVAIDRGHAYVGVEADGNTGVVIIDVRQLASARQVAFVPGKGVGLNGDVNRDFALSDGFLYLPYDWSGLQVVDVRDPAKPNQVKYLLECAAGPICEDIGNYFSPVHFTVHDHFLYATQQSNDGIDDSLLVFDIAAPSDPILLGRIVIGEEHSLEQAEDLASLGSKILVATDRIGRRLDYLPELRLRSSGGALRVADTSNPTQLTWRGIFAPAISYGKGVIAGERAYVATGADVGVMTSVNVLDLSSPGALRDLGRLPDVSAIDIVAKGPWCVIEAWGWEDHQLLVFSAESSDPLKPIGELIMPLAGSQFGFMHWEGDKLYVPISNNVLIYDMTLPSKPVLSATAVVSGHLSAVTNGVGLTAAEDGGSLEAVDLRNAPMTKTMGSLFISKEKLTKVVTADEFAYVTDASRVKLFVVDLHRPDRMKLVNAMSLDYAVDLYSAVIDGQTLLLAEGRPDSWNLVHAYDLTNPAEPRQFALFRQPSHTRLSMESSWYPPVWGLTVKNDRVLVGSANDAFVGGLLALRLVR